MQFVPRSSKNIKGETIHRRSMISVSNETNWRIWIKLAVGELVICLFGFFLYIFLLPNVFGFIQSIIMFLGFFIRWIRLIAKKESNRWKENFLKSAYNKKYWWLLILVAGVSFLLFYLDLPFLSHESAFLLPGLLSVYLEIETVVLWKVLPQQQPQTK